MTTYTPTPVVTFDGGQVFTDQTIANISISMGRNDVIEQPQAGYARVELWADSNEPIAINLSDAVVVSINNAAGGTVDVFNGIISDIEITLDQFGDRGSIARYAITAIGPLAQLNRRTAGASGFSKEFDGTRMLNILTEAFLTSWSDVGATVTWQDLPNSVTWASYDATSEALVNALTSTVDVPGQYELAVYSDGAANALDLAIDAAQSGRGVIYEGGDGHLHYDDYAARATNTPLTLVGSDLLIDGIKTAAQWSEIVNDVTVTYASGGTKYARDEQSIVLYGQLAGSRTTTLHNAADAQTQADAFLASRAYPRTYPEQFTVALHNPTVSNATRTALGSIYNGLPITTSALPAVFGTTFNGYVEGWTWNITRYEAIVTMICSAQSETYTHKVWYQIPPTQTWTAYPSSTKWSDL